MQTTLDLFEAPNGPAFIHYQDSTKKYLRDALRIARRMGYAPVAIYDSMNKGEAEVETDDASPIEVQTPTQGAGIPNNRQVSDVTCAASKSGLKKWPRRLATKAGMIHPDPTLSGPTPHDHLRKSDDLQPDDRPKKGDSKNGK